MVGQISINRAAQLARCADRVSGKHCWQLFKAASNAGLAQLLGGFSFQAYCKYQHCSCGMLCYLRCSLKCLLQAGAPHSTSLLLYQRKLPIAFMTSASTMLLRVACRNTCSLL